MIRKNGVPDEEPIDPAVVLRDLSARWRLAPTVEYRSLAVIAHVGEVRIEVRTHARLRRPGFARLVFLASRDDYSRLRVCDGRAVRDRNKETAVRAGRTLLTPFTGRMTGGIPHPLDEAGYSVDQFFARTPFVPPPLWGEGDDPTARRGVAAVRVPRKDPATGRRRDRFRLTFTRGRFRDTLLLDAASFSPVEIVRFGVHAGLAQETMRETFSSVRLGVNLPPGLFQWTREDEAGAALRG